MRRSLAIVALTAVSLVSAALAVAQPNLQPFQPSGWARPLVPRPAPDAAWNYVPGPTTLPGNAASTYWNESCWNAGSSSTGGSFWNYLWIDGLPEGTSQGRYLWGVLPAASYSTHTNGGPVTVPGGRHTFELRVDAGDAIGESNENDNAYARQWIWTPLVLAAGSQTPRPAPPQPEGGWGSIPAGEEKYPNCDGLRFTVGTGWSVVIARILDTWDSDRDLDVHLYSPSTAATQGFAEPLASSERRGGGIDGVIANGRFLSGLTYDVGVVHQNWAFGLGAYMAEHIVSQALALGDSLTFTLAQDQALRIWEVPVGAADVGPLTVTLRMLGGSGSVMLQWLDRSFQRGGMNDFTAGTATDDAGLARLSVNAATAGYYAVVVMRDPVWGLDPRSFTLEVEPALPDLAYTEPVGWHSPLVPHQGTYDGGALPDTLVGYPDYQGWTRVYFGQANLGLGPAAERRDGLFVDGALFDTFSMPALNPATYTWGFVHIPLLPIRGGRHTLHQRFDYPDRLEEMSETNNVYGEQYCWAPLSISFGQTLTCPAPPEPYGGQESLPAGVVFFPNCDGLRLASTAQQLQHARAIAVMPGAGTSLRLSLFNPLQHAKWGFDYPRYTSTAGVQGQSDWLLLTPDCAEPLLDIGVRREIGAYSYQIAAVAAPKTWLIDRPLRIPGALELAEILDLIEIGGVPAGPLAMRLDNTAGALDWGLAVFYTNSGSPVWKKAEAPYRSEMNGPGEPEWLTFTSGGPELRYAIAVYKIRSEDMTSRGEYTLWLAPGVTAVDDAPPAPAQTRLAGAQPNPFNPRTTIAFELAAAAEARLSIVDLQGRRLRALAAGPLPAGRHEVVWDGRDDAGRQLPSGAYMVELSAGGARQMSKLLLVK